MRINNHKQTKPASGFTLVELLIVIVVIAILAAISVVAYNGIQNRSADTTVKSDLAAAAKTLEMYRVDNSQYPSYAQMGAMPTRLKFTKSSYQTASNAVLYCLSSDQQKYALLGKSKSNTTLMVASWKTSPHVYTLASFPGTAAITCGNIDSDLGGQIWIHSGDGWINRVDG